MSLTIKNFIKSIIIVLMSLLISAIIINILYYYDIINNNITKYIKMILSISIFFVSGVYIGKNSPSKGYINGLKLSLIMTIIFIIFGIIFGNISVSRIIFYLIMTISITFGAMIGISKNAN